MIRSEKRLRLCMLLMALNLAFIWGNSLLPGELSAAFSDWVRELLAALLPWGGSQSSGSGLLRKLAHFSEFAMLGVLLCWFWGMLEKHPCVALVCGILAACADETIQRFVPDRGPSVRDVFIDTCGVAAGILLLWLGYTVLKKRKNNHPLEEMNQ